MSFADELRGITAEDRQGQQAAQAARAAQAEKTWPLFVDFVYDQLKGMCMESAQRGVNYASEYYFLKSTFSDFRSDECRSPALYDPASGQRRAATQEERELVNLFLGLILGFDCCLAENKAQELIRQIETRFRKEGLEVRTSLRRNHYIEWEYDIDFSIEW